MYDLHFGLSPATFDRWERDSDLPVGSDLDGWNAWGESTGTDVNDPTTLHVIVQNPSHMILTGLAGLLVTEYRGFLVPMGGLPHQTGVLAVITPTDDWSDVLNQYR